MARFLSPHPDDPSLAFYEDDNGQPFIGPAEMQAGIEEEAQPPAQQMPTTDAEVLAQLNQMGQDLGEDRLGGMGASEPIAQNFDTEPGAMFDVSDSSAIPGVFTPEPGAMFAADPPQEEEPVEEPPAEAQRQFPDAPGVDPSIMRQTVGGMGASGSQLSRMQRHGFGIDRSGRPRRFIEPKTGPSGGGRAAPPANATAGILSGTAVPGEVMNELDAASEQTNEAARRAAFVEMQTAEQQSDVMQEELAADDARIKRMEMQVEQWQQDAYEKVQELNGFLQEMSEQNINPDRFFAQRGDAARFGTAISIAASAMGQVLAPGTPNTAMSIINAAIERDVQAQVANMQNTQATMQAGNTLFRTLMEHYKDQRSALAALRAIRLQQADNRLRGIALRNQSPAAWAGYEQQQAEIASRIAAVYAELQSRQFQINMSGPMSIPAITQTVGAIEERPLTEPTATDLRSAARPQEVVGTAKRTEEGQPEFPSDDPAMIQESIQNRIRQEEREAGIQPEQQARRRVGRSVPRGQRLGGRRGGSGQSVGGIRPERGVVQRVSDVVPEGQDLFSYIEAVETHRDWPAHLDIIISPDRDHLQVMGINEGFVDRQDIDALEERAPVSIPLGDMGTLSVLPGMEKRHNEILNSERGEREWSDLQMLPLAYRLMRRLRELRQGAGSRIPMSEARGEARGIMRELVSMFTAIDRSGVLNEGEREYFLNDRLPDVTTFFETPAAAAQLDFAIQMIPRRAEAAARGLFATFQSPETVGPEIEADNPGQGGIDLSQPARRGTPGVTSPEQNPAAQGDVTEHVSPQVFHGRR